MPTVIVNLKNRPDGSVVEVPYLGAFKNGETTEVTQERWDRFVKYQPGAAHYAESGELKLVTEKAEPRQTPTSPFPEPKEEDVDNEEPKE